MEVRVLGLQYVKREDLVPMARNVRRHGSVQRRRFRGLLERFGFAGALLGARRADGKVQILDGHMRLEEAALEEYPVVLVDLPESDWAEFSAAVDRITAQADCDNDALAEMYEQMSDAVKALFSELEARCAELAKSEKPKYELVPEWDEHYDAVLVFCRTQAEWAWLQTVLGLERREDRWGNVGITRVITCPEFKAKWEARGA
jgi:hypothetical protein